MEDQFGSCPVCGRNDGYRNIYSQHFFFCEEHRITWSVGSNLLSSWREESREDWRGAWEELKDYRLFDPDAPGEVGPTLAEETSFDTMVPPGAPPPARERPHRFGDDPYPGELRDLMSELDGRRQEVAQDLGAEHPLFRLIDSALRVGDLEDLRTARAAGYGAVRCGYYPQGGDFDNMPI
jgi:hypothetical protein